MRLLVAEDEKSLSRALKTILERNNYTVDAVYNGPDAITYIENTPYDAVILDIMMPGLDGFDVCRGIRAEKDIPIIIVSARKEDFDKINALGIGADDYVVKPFSPGELVARAKAHLARYERLTGGKIPGDELRAGPLTIHKKARRMFINGKELTFTNKEFDLLTFLAEHPNTVFTKDELFNSIWESDPMGETSTITVHINRIRDKIKELGEPSAFIETVWGSGYRFRS